MTTQEENFAYRVRHALNEKLDDLPEDVAVRLKKAREEALSRKRQVSPVHVRVLRAVFAGNADYAFSSLSWLGQLRFGLPALVLAIGLFGIVHFEEQRHIRETAAIDMAVLSDELPPKAYTDIGFSAYLERAGA